MIAKDLNLSAPAVSRAVDVLLERADIYELKKVQLENGKKVVPLQFNTCKGFVIGIDLLRNPCRMVIADFSGKLVKQWSGFSMDRETDITEELIETTKKMVSAFIEELKADPEKYHCVESSRDLIKAIGIGVPATVDKNTGVVLGTQRYDYMLGKNYGERMSEAFGLPAFVDNITNMSAIAERKLGVSRNLDHSVFFELSAGVGLGIYIHGRLYPGSFGAAGEIGYTPTSIEHLHDERFGHLGVLERMIAMDGIAAQAKVMNIVDASLPTMEANHQLFELAYQGDERALTIRNVILQNLVVLCSNIILILNPEQVVIGGTMVELPHMEALLLKPLQKELQEIIPFDIPPVVISVLGDNSGVHGAVEMTLERLKSEWYPYRSDTDFTHSNSIGTV